MPGTILSAVAKKRIADCHVASTKYVNERAGLIEIYKAARVSLVKGEHFDRVCEALSKRAQELGVYKKGAF